MFTLFFILSLKGCSWSSPSVHLSLRPAEATEKEAERTSAEPSAEGRRHPEEGAAEFSRAQTWVVIHTGPGRSDVPESSVRGPEEHPEPCGPPRPHSGPRFLRRGGHPLLREQFSTCSRPQRSQPISRQAVGSEEAESQGEGASKGRPQRCEEKEE